MSLFENEEYQWRETYFVLFDAERRPAAARLAELLQQIDSRYRIDDVRSNAEGQFESLTLRSPDDYSAMDITCLQGDEVREQVAELVAELKRNASESDQKTLRRLAQCTGRIEVYHFEQLVFVGAADENEPDDFMDPGSLLVVLERIAQLCDGIVVDPQAGALL